MVIRAPGRGTSEGVICGAGELLRVFSGRADGDQSTWTGNQRGRDQRGWCAAAGVCLLTGVEVKTSCNMFAARLRLSSDAWE